MSTDDRPSIAELQRSVATGYGWPNANAIAVNHAAPVLLEIAAAALARQEAERTAAIEGTARAIEAEQLVALDLRNALAKVRP